MDEVDRCKMIYSNTPHLEREEDEFTEMLINQFGKKVAYIAIYEFETGRIIHKGADNVF